MKWCASAIKPTLGRFLEIASCVLCVCVCVRVRVCVSIVLPFYNYSTAVLKLSYSAKLWWWKSLTTLTNGCWIIPTKILHLESFRYCIFYRYNSWTWVCHVMSGHRFWSTYFRPILDKKDLPEDKELPDPSGPLSKVIPSSSIATCNAEVTNVLKQAKRSVAKNRYTKLTPCSLPHILKNMETTAKENEYISQPSRPCDNSTIIFIFSGTNKNITQFIKVLLVKLSDMLDLSNFVWLFHCQNFALYGNYLTHYGSYRTVVPFDLLTQNTTMRRYGILL